MSLFKRWNVLNYLATAVVLWGAAGPISAVEPPGLPPNADAEARAGGTIRYFTAAAIGEMRDKGDEAVRMMREAPEGWSKSPVDPNKIMTAFPALRLREGFTLRAYVYGAGGNGNGVVWAMPADAEFPEPEDCPRLESRFLKVPKPLDALDDVMDGIDGDDTAEAYLQASLLRRELKEFGARWHGIVWGTHQILDADPLVGSRDENGDPMRTPRGKPNDWKWIGSRPADWRPRVKLEVGKAIVEFYTFSGYRKESIHRYVDEYRRGKFRPKVEEKTIAEGLPGYVF
jgi:hypothetical protein